MKEVGQLLRALGMTPTHLQVEERKKCVVLFVFLFLFVFQVRELIREYDKNKDGVLGFKEFLDLYADVKCPPAGSKELLEAFQVFDKKKTGTIAATDLTEGTAGMWCRACKKWK
jgi:hypothetical protein